MSPIHNSAKADLRRHITSILSQLNEADISAASSRAQRAVLALPAYTAARRIAVYLSMPKGEARTEAIVRDALASGKEVFVPYIYRPADGGEGKKKRRIIDMLRLESVAEWEGLERDGWGIPSLEKASVGGKENAMGGVGLSFKQADEQEMGGGEDRGDEVEGRGLGGLDLIVVPGVAFDEGMHRLGHGGGFYDSYLTRFCDAGRRPKPFLVGLCLTPQFLLGHNAVPVTESDWRVDAVAIGDGKLAELDQMK